MRQAEELSTTVIPAAGGEQGQGWFCCNGVTGADNGVFFSFELNLLAYRSFGCDRKQFCNGEIPFCQYL
jgi:hypothetical protein